MRIIGIKVIAPLLVQGMVLSGMPADNRAFIARSHGAHRSSLSPAVEINAVALQAKFTQWRGDVEFLVALLDQAKKHPAVADLYDRLKTAVTDAAWEFPEVIEKARSVSEESLTRAGYQELAGMNRIAKITEWEEAVTWQGTVGRERVYQLRKTIDSQLRVIEGVLSAEWDQGYAAFIKVRMRKRAGNVFANLVELINSLAIGMGYDRQDDRFAAIQREVMDNELAKKLFVQARTAGVDIESTIKNIFASDNPLVRNTIIDIETHGEAWIEKQGAGFIKSVQSGPMGDVFAGVEGFADINDKDVFRKTAIGHIVKHTFPYLADDLGNLAQQKPGDENLIATAILKWRQGYIALRSIAIAARRLQIADVPRKQESAGVERYSLASMIAEEEKWLNILRRRLKQEGKAPIKLDEGIALKFPRSGLFEFAKSGKNVLVLNKETGKEILFTVGPVGAERFIFIGDSVYILRELQLINEETENAIALQTTKAGGVIIDVSKLADNLQLQGVLEEQRDNVPGGLFGNPEMNIRADGVIGVSI